MMRPLDEHLVMPESHCQAILEEANLPFTPLLTPGYWGLLMLIRHVASIAI